MRLLLNVYKTIIILALVNLTWTNLQWADLQRILHWQKRLILGILTVYQAVLLAVVQQLYPAVLQSGLLALIQVGLFVNQHPSVAL